MRIYPHLWFESQAEDEMAFYTSIFKDSKMLGRTDLPEPELSVVRFELAGLPVPPSMLTRTQPTPRRSPS